MTADSEERPGETQARRLESVGERLRALLSQMDITQHGHATPGNDVWSAMQTMGHTVEMIPYWLNHCQTLIAAAEPPTFGRTLENPERLAGVERGATDDPNEVLRRLNDEVQTAASAIRAMSAVERAKKGLHLRRGEMTVADVIEVFIVTHAEEHLEQVRAAFQT